MNRLVEHLTRHNIQKVSVQHLNDIVQQLGIPIDQTKDGVIIPAYDIINDKKYMKILVELPGVEKKSLKIDFNNNKIIITGEKKNSYKTNIAKNEIKYGKIERKIVLPVIIEDESDVSITLKDGILLIKLDKQNMSDNSFTVTF